METTISMPIGTALREVENQAQRRYGGLWEVEPRPSGVWRDPLNEANFIWLVRRKLYFCP